jgi:sodium/hydrogen exchanger 8
MPSWRQLGLSPSPSSSTPTVNAHEFGALNTLGLCLVLGMCVFAGYWLKQRKFYYLPESAAIMLIGALTGGLVEWLWPTGDELSFLKFNPQMFFFRSSSTDHL